MILKAGTYRFNDVVDLSLFEAPLIDNAENMEGLLFPFVSNEIQFNIISVNNTSGGFVNTTILGYLNTINDECALVYNSEGNIWEKDYQFFTIGEDVELIDEYANAIIKNTNYNEVNTTPLAEITYNGETIAQLNAGETATLSCKDKKMVSDVVVKVNEVESKIPEGYIKPEGTLELVFNNIEAEFPIDCSQYAKVTVNTAEPLKISDPTVLDNITDSPWGVGGNVFLYEGATTDSYENGTLYYLEDTEK